MNIDISHIFGWQGRLTGIERVEYHLIAHYFEHAEYNVQFVTWDQSQVAFVAVTHDEVKRTILDRSSIVADLPATAHTVKGRIVNKIKKLNTKNRESGRGAELFAIDKSAGEAFVVLAGLWDNLEYISALKKAQSAGLKLVHVVYDMIPILQPQYMVNFLPPIFSNYMYEVLPGCVGVLAISDSTAKDTETVLRQKGLSVPHIFSFRLGDDLPSVATEVRPEGIEGDFLLSVSTIESRKNHTILYYLYKRAAEKGVELPGLLIVGKRGWHTSDFQYLIENDPQVKGKVRILDNIDDSRLRWLYKNAKAVVFPSYYEGWGLPVAEALRYGKIVISSNTSSMPEIGAKLVDYFSPHSADELLEILRAYLTDDKKLKAREQEIRQHYKETSWEDAAMAFDAKLENITSKP